MKRSILFILAFISCALYGVCADGSKWTSSGSSFSMDFNVYPVCDTVVAIPRGQSYEIELSTRTGKLNLTLRHIVGMKEVVVDNDGMEFIEYKGGTVQSSRTWSLSLSFNRNRISNGITYSLFTGTANSNGKAEPCSLEIAVNNNNPNTEVIDLFGDDEATEYLDSYTISIGGQKWGSMDICGLFSPEIPRYKKVQNALRDYLSGKKSKTVNKTPKSTSKPPLKK